MYNKSVIYQISVTVLEFTLYDYIEILEGISVTVGCIVSWFFQMLFFETFLLEGLKQYAFDKTQTQFLTEVGG